MEDNSAVVEQLRREQQQTLEARALAMQSLLEGIESGDVDRVPTARRIIARSFKLLSESLDTILKTTKTRTVGLDWLRIVGPSKASLLFLRKLISLTLAGDQIDIQGISVAVGRHIIEEGLVLQAEHVNNLYMQKAYQYMQKRGVHSVNHARLTMRAAVKAVMKDSIDIEAQAALQTAKWVIRSAVECGLVSIIRSNGTKHGKPLLRVDEELSKLLFDTRFVDTMSGTGLLMVAKPNDWEPGMIGGYLAPTQNKLARRVRKDDHLLCRKGLEQSTAYLEALNNLQAVPFEIDQRALSIVRRIWLSQDDRMLSIPSINPTKSPEFPFGLDWDVNHASDLEKLQFLNWKHRKSEWYTSEKKRKGEASRVGLLLREGVELKGRRVYAPVHGDWRGRMYYSGTPNPQGPDYSRASIRFFDKKPLGEDGLFWLKVHIANSFGVDKGRFKTRAQWVDENMDVLVDGMLRPEDSDIYREVADYPVLAAVAVQELVEALDSKKPEDYLSGLPIHMDATCSGLQHYSALLRDPVGGRYVNLLDDGQPEKNDIYSKVLDTVKIKLAERLRFEDCVLASEWLKMPLDRKITKKPVMTYVYNSTLRGVSTHCMSWLLDNGFNTKGVSIFSMGDFMAKLLFKSIEEAVPAAADCMAWIGRAVRQHGIQTPFSWKTPINTQVFQKYRQTKQAKVYLRTCNVESVIILQDLETTRLKKMVDAAAPNFIHSLDSAHAARVANRMASMDKQVVSIHDSIGTHACDVTTLHKVIREEFVSMYTEHNPLETILKLNNCDLELPVQGNLDLRRVLDSEFFFC